MLIYLVWLFVVSQLVILSEEVELPEQREGWKIGNLQAVEKDIYALDKTQ